MKAKLIFIGKKQKHFFEKPNTQIPKTKNCHFPAPPISNLPFWNKWSWLIKTAIVQWNPLINNWFFCFWYNFVFAFFKKQMFLFFPNENQLGFHMRHFFLSWKRLHSNTYAHDCKSSVCCLAKGHKVIKLRQAGH